VDPEPEMTELDEAVADVRREPDRIARLAAALYLASKKRKQVDLVKRTGLTRETIRRHVEDEKIRRGEIDPTPRYLKEQEKRAARARRDS
jgi:predicted transcriptional regulator